MRIHIIVEQRPGGGARYSRVFDLLGAMGCQVFLEDRLPERSLDPSAVFLIDARSIEKQVLRRLTELAARRADAPRVIALTRPGEPTFQMSMLLRAGVLMVVPYGSDEPGSDTGGLESSLRIMLKELRATKRKAGPRPPQPG